MTARPASSAVISPLAEERDPNVSVLMTVYNGLRYLQAAVESILSQSYENFELIVVDDGSCDGSTEWLKRVGDKRLKLIMIEHAGLTGALNAGLGACRGQYLARMDADDIAAPSRIEDQVAFLSKNLDVDVVCTDIIVIDEDGTQIGKETFRGLTSKSLRDALLYKKLIKPVVHPSVMMRREVFEALHGYRNFTSAEDHDFWLRCTSRFEVRRLNKPLLHYRRSATGISRTKATQQAASACMSAVCDLVQRQTAVDIFDERPEIYSMLLTRVASRLEREVNPGAGAFRRARDLFRRRRVAGAFSLAFAVIRYGRSALPYGVLAQTRRIVKDACVTAVRVIEGSDAVG